MHCHKKVLHGAGLGCDYEIEATLGKISISLNLQSWSRRHAGALQVGRDDVQSRPRHMLIQAFQGIMLAV